jgi:hypothetical protein
MRAVLFSLLTVVVACARPPAAPMSAPSDPLLAQASAAPDSVRISDG